MYVIRELPAYDRDVVFWRMENEGLLGAAMYSTEAPTYNDWLDVLKRVDILHGTMIGAYDENGVLAGFAQFMPVLTEYADYEFDFCVFRHAFKDAVHLGHLAAEWAFENIQCDRLVGITPITNRHAWRIAEACGFRRHGVTPNLCYVARKHKKVDGVITICTPESLKEATMGFIGGSTPSYTPAPEPKKQLATKSVTESATAARDAQKEKAKKAGGLSGSILTNQNALGGTGNSGTMNGRSVLGG